MQSSCEVSGAAHLPRGACRPDGAATLLRLEGIPPSIAYRRDKLIATPGVTRRRSKFWRAPTRASSGPLFAMSIRWPTSAIARLAALRAASARARASRRPSLSKLDARWFYDWAGGLIWLDVPAERRCGERRHSRGDPRRPCHADPRARDRARRSAGLPAAGAGACALVRRVKTAFDPMGMFNPGRM